MSDTSTCRWDIGDGAICGDEATSTVTVRDAVTKVIVPVCATHRATYNKRAAKLRTNRT